MSSGDDIVNSLRLIRVCDTQEFLVVCLTVSEDFFSDTIPKIS